MSPPKREAPGWETEGQGTGGELISSVAASVTRSPNGKSRPKSRPFYKVECEALKQELRYFKPSEWMIYGVMQAYRGLDGEAYPELRTVAAVTHLHTSTVQRTLASLCKKHWLVKCPPRWKGRNSTTYLVREFSFGASPAPSKAPELAASDNGTSLAKSAPNSKNGASRQVVLESTSARILHTANSAQSPSFETWVAYATAKGKHNPQAYARKAIKQGWALPKNVPIAVAWPVDPLGWCTDPELRAQLEREIAEQQAIR